MLVKELNIWPPLILAPMAGLTHSALRTTILSFGGVGLLTTEMLGATRLPCENEWVSPYLIRTELERPLSYQLLVFNEEEVAPAIAKLHQLGAEMVDFNLGCPAPRVRKAGGGSGLMDNLEMVTSIIKKARAETGLPLSAKIRLGGNELNEQQLRSFCSMLEAEGIDLLSVHCRLGKESFQRKPRWEWVKKIKDWVSIPVVANGGIDSVESAKKCLQVSGANGLMIGRAAAVKPWLFADIAREVYGEPVSIESPNLPKAYMEFKHALEQRFRVERRLGRLKEFTHYFAENYFFGHHLATRVQSCDSVDAAWRVAVDFFAKNDPDSLAELKIGPLSS